MSGAPQLRWSGWGERDFQPSPEMLAALEQRLGISGEIVAPAVAIDNVSIPKAHMTAQLRSALTKVVGEESLLENDADRIKHSVGRSYVDLLALRQGKLEHPPDAVLYPRDSEQIAQVLGVCAAHGCAVVPFGGGTSVVGGVEAVRGDHASVVSLDLRECAGICDVDKKSQLVKAHAGSRAVDFEAELNQLGLTLGHFPQSFDFATLGGYAATRSAGQASNGFGRFSDMVVGMTCQTPAGEIVCRAFPASAAGPSIKELLLGSEGCLGVITEVDLRVHRRAERSRFEAWSFPTFIDGIQAVRELVQNGNAPDVIRLSDEAETELNMVLAAPKGLVGQALRGYLRTHGQLHGAMFILGWDRYVSGLAANIDAAAITLSQAGGIPLGTRPGKSWLEHRYEGPYVRDALMDRGVLVETVETATSWSNLSTLHTRLAASLTESLRGADGLAPLVGCHVSHAYQTGASLYFTVLCKVEGDGAAQWRQAKAKVTDEIIANGGTLSHHHGVGLDHAAWLEREIGAVPVSALRAIKNTLDPRAIMNPGKLLAIP